MDPKKLGVNLAKGAASYFAGSMVSSFLGMTTGLAGFAAKELPAAAAWFAVSRVFGQKPGVLHAALGGGISYFAGATASNIIGAGGAIDMGIKAAGAGGGAILATQILG